jgi:hypothetical protein
MLFKFIEVSKQYTFTKHRLHTDKLYSLKNKIYWSDLFMDHIHLISIQPKYPNRYYSIEFYKNLFDEFLVVRNIGSSQNTRPTKVMKNIFTSYEEAALFIKQIIHKKSNHYMKV